LRRPEVAGAAVCEDTLLVCVDGSYRPPPLIEVEGRTLETEVLVTGRFQASAGAPDQVASVRFRNRRRPLQAGYSLGTLSSVGTGGLFVLPERGAAQGLLLTAGHVVARGRGSGRTAVLQPAGPDGGLAAQDRVGSVWAAMPPDRARLNHMDAAVILLQTGIDLELEYPDAGYLRGHCALLRRGWTVRKAGRSTGSVVGRIVATEWAGVIDYRWGRHRFAGQVLIHGDDRCLALPGDSGSVWVTDSGYAAALSFSATDRSGHYSIATPIDRVLKTFGLAVAVPASV
jgi:hypothetical protein